LFKEPRGWREKKKTNPTQPHPEEEIKKSFTPPPPPPQGPFLSKTLDSPFHVKLDCPRFKIVNKQFVDFILDLWV
jgi:hypothetical protein